jgi:hypothetical protein
MVTRFEPALPPEHRKTYQILAPRGTHWRRATCEEAQCQNYLFGWRTIVAADVADQVRSDLRRGGWSFTEQAMPGGLAELSFPAGQRCFRFSQHTVRIDKPEVFVVRGGDWRGNPRGEVRRHAGPDPWVDDFATHQDGLRTRMDQG